MNVQIEERLTAVEKRVELEAGLRAKLETDVSDIQVRQKATLKLVEALRETQVGQGQRQEEQGLALADLGQAFGRMETRMDGLDARMERLEAGMGARMDGLDGRMERLEAGMERVIAVLEPPSAN